MSTELKNKPLDGNDAKLPVSRSALQAGYEVMIRFEEALSNVYADDPTDDDKWLLDRCRKFIKGVKKHFC